MHKYYPPQSSSPYGLSTGKINPTQRTTSTAASELVDSDSSQPSLSVHPSAPMRPILQGNSNGTAAMHSREGTGEYIETRFEPHHARVRSPRRSNEDIEVLIRELRAELSRHAKLLRESLHLIFTRIETIKTQHDKLDSNRKLIEDDINDLASTSKAVASERMDQYQ